MVVQFTPEQEERLSLLARTEGVAPERLVQDAALRLLEAEAAFRSAIKLGISQADQGDLIEESEMDIRFEKLLRS